MGSVVNRLRSNLIEMQIFFFSSSMMPGVASISVITTFLRSNLTRNSGNWTFVFVYLGRIEQQHEVVVILIIRLQYTFFSSDSIFLNVHESSSEKIRFLGMVVCLWPVETAHQIWSGFHFYFLK